MRAPTRRVADLRTEKPMPLTDLIATDAVIPALKVNGKKQALQELAARAAELTGQSERAVLEVLQMHKVPVTVVP